MKDFNLGKWIKRFILLTLLFTFYDATMNELDEMIETAKANKSEINENINTENIITMIDLGFEHHETTNSKLEAIDPRIDSNGSVYKLQIDNDDVNNYIWMNFTFYNFSSKDIANESFETLTKVLYKNELKGIECYIGTCVIPNIDYETTIQRLVSLDNWDIDRGFAMRELFIDGINNLILQKDNQIIVVFYSDGDLLDESCIPTLTNLFSKTDEIFK